MSAERKQLLGADRGYIPQPAPYEYKPQSVFIRNKVISIVFALLAAALAAFFWKSLQRPRRIMVPDPPPPVYVEPVAPAQARPH